MNEKCFDWENFPHQPTDYNADWALDFGSSPPRPFKQCDFIRLYNGGPLEIRGNPYCDPSQRIRLRREFGLNYSLWSDLGGFELYTPDWRPIRKGATDLACVLLDYNHNVLVAPSAGGNAAVTYYSPHAWPVGGRTFDYCVPNRERAKRLKAVMADVLAFARTLYTLDPEQRPRKGPRAADYVYAFLHHQGELNVTPETHGHALYELGCYVAERRIDSHIARWTEDQYSGTYLRFKEKK